VLTAVAGEHFCPSALLVRLLKNQTRDSVGRKTRRELKPVRKNSSKTTHPKVWSRDGTVITMFAVKR
jgi:hypothetical protein